jgi:hypothetical protein
MSPTLYFPWEINSKVRIAVHNGREDLEASIVLGDVTSTLTVRIFCHMEKLGLCVLRI